MGITSRSCATSCASEGFTRCVKRPVARTSMSAGKRERRRSYCAVTCARGAAVSAHWAATITAVRKANPECGIEVLIPDFKGRKEASRESLARVIEARPDVLAHNLETVSRIHPKIRPGFGYDASLKLLQWSKELRADQVTKSNLI